MNGLLTLQSDFWQLEVLPALGASVLNLRAASGRPVMRPVRLENVKTSSQCASFALLPFSNRIRDAAFDFAGEHVQLRVTTADGLTQHSDVRNRPWQLARQTPGSLILPLTAATLMTSTGPGPLPPRCITSCAAPTLSPASALPILRNAPCPPEWACTPTLTSAAGRHCNWKRGAGIRMTSAVCP